MLLLIVLSLTALHDDEHHSGRSYIRFVNCWVIFCIVIVVANLIIVWKTQRNKLRIGHILLFFMPALFGIILITTVCLICCIRRCRCNSSYAKLSEELHTTIPLVIPTTYATTTATSSESAKEPYNSATAIQIGDTNRK